MIDDFLITAAMIEYGGGFVKRLAMAYRAADSENREKIKTTWPEYWAKYTAMAEKESAR
ncbi:MAG: hypothetical protein ACO3FE_23175 [Planctomycetaceae bacterium]